MANEEIPVRRAQVEVRGRTLSYLTSGKRGAGPLLLLHGTFWGRVWLPVLPALGQEVHCVALDLPGFGRSGGQLDVPDATVPALAQTVLEAADALGLETFDLAGHDIGGGIAQHLAAHSGRVRRLVLVNSVMFDSWPVPAVERFRDPHLRRTSTPQAFLQARGQTTRRAVARRLTEEELAEYVSPWQDASRMQSWMAMAAAADPKYTLDLVPALKAAAVPTRLIWGRDDEFQKISYARQYVGQIPDSDLIEVPGKHIPMEDAPNEVAAAMLEHLRS